MSERVRSRKIAVVGGGIAGLGAAWLLNRRHDVTLFERNAYIGGHSNTLDAPDGRGGTIPVDTGFIVYNERTYPNLIALFDHLGVERIKTDMSFGVTLDRGRLEYGGSTLWSLFAQKRNVFRPRFHRMVRDILRFYKQAPQALAGGAAGEQSLGAFLQAAGYSEAFVDDHLLPMAAAIWSCPVSTMTEFPADSFIRFFDNHGLLQVNDRPQWWTVKDGSREYVKRILADLPRVEANAKTVRVTRLNEGVEIQLADGRVERFDDAVLACHADEALEMISDPSAAEAATLSAFRYQENRAVLHTDVAQMPKRRGVWSSWNYLAGRDMDRERQVAVSYWMNSLQSLDAQDLFVTLNPFDPIRPETVIAEIAYDHPVFDQGAIQAQQTLPGLQGANRLWFCGAYCGYGFHEDGLGSAVAVAKRLGAPAPWGDKPVHAMHAVLGAPAAARSGAGDMEAAA
ncbi:MAG: FAD-dependent oxidoreductase [Marivibrio sp.]|uniref:NAD(P)/FAD-dependent oxidoreductase n=1 Tax=Marivibrio sp. TaxID=2039719 RepID=UPI0032EC918D